ncbi:MAG: radical SAM protein [Candidatus Undinarchaeales archaeon]|nr:radical SAM protein [Candidatus Undinarchaeales archaeon]MDP7491446.1 radical SAM protein [Candidatus Undinarchaeales archaeon]
MKGSKPVYVILFVTARCNARCKHCFYWKNIDQAEARDELKLEEIERICKGLGQLMQVSLTGGETFLRNDLVEICNVVCRYTNPLIITITTNGLLTEKIEKDMEMILEQNPGTHFRISISLDGWEEEHDLIRDVKGIFEAVTRTYDSLDKLRKRHDNLNIDFCTVLSSYNVDNIRGIFNSVEERFDADNHLLTLLRGTPRCKSAIADTLDAYEEMQRYIEVKEKKREKKPFDRFLHVVYEESLREIINTARKKSMVVPCVAGERLIEISETGDVFPCELLDKKMGNIRDFDYDINRLLASKGAEQVRRSIRDKKCYCTFECAINASVIFDFKRYPRLLGKIFFKRFN